MCGDVWTEEVEVPREERMIVRKQECDVLQVEGMVAMMVMWNM